MPNNKVTRITNPSNEGGAAATANTEAIDQEDRMLNSKEEGTISEHPAREEDQEVAAANGDLRGVHPSFSLPETSSRATIYSHFWNPFLNVCS